MRCWCAVCLFFVVTYSMAQQAVNVEAARTESPSAGALLLRQLVSGLQNPWALALLPANEDSHSGGALITERGGRMLLLTSLVPAQGKLRSVTGLPDIYTAGQGGLLDISLSPSFARDKRVYFSYVTGDRRRSATSVAYGVLQGSHLSHVTPVFTMNHHDNSRHHYGSRLVFDAEGYLYITIGDRGNRNYAQDTKTHAGSLLRIMPNGDIPADNPFVKTGAPEIYSYGHRNAQGMLWHPLDGHIWIHEHGPRGGDEINIIYAGKNYGWPIVTQGREYSGAVIAQADSLPHMQDPLLHWTPSIAPSGMALVMAHANARHAAWNGALLIGALAGRHLRLVRMQEREVVEQEILFQNFARFRDVRQSTESDGTIYVLTDERPGGLYRLEFTE